VFKKVIGEKPYFKIPVGKLSFNYKSLYYCYNIEEFINTRDVVDVRLVIATFVCMYVSVFM
jgi:hypothetical protein